MLDVKRVLVAYDGSECAEAALDDLKKAGLREEGVEALIVSVAEVWLPPPANVEEVEASAVGATASGIPANAARATKANVSGQLPPPPALAEASRLAEQARTRLSRNFPGWIVRAESTNGSPAWEVINLSDTWRPDLAVVGSHGRKALGRFVLGSVSQKVVTEARCSVRVARGRVGVDPSPARIIVAVDGSPGGDAAVRAVAAREWPEGTEVEVVIVDDPLSASPVGRLIPPVARWVERSNLEERAWVQRDADESAEELRAAGVNVTARVLEGDPKRELVAEAERWGADCIFMGSTGITSTLERFLLGSVSAAVAARAHCSVEVVRERRPSE